jgi:cell division protein FtsL
MADYNRSEAYDLSLYAMPAYAPDVQKETVRPARKPQIVKTKKTASQLRKESVASAVHALKIFVVAVTLLTLFGEVLFSRISLAMLEKEAVQIADQIKDAESENTRLVMQLNSSVSREKVDEYAVSVLGMQKLERYQIHYFENRDGDKVVMADGKAVEDKANADG